MRASEEEKPEFEESLSLSSLTLVAVPLGKKPNFDPEDFEELTK